jgi:hypothetical protein
MMMNKEMDAAPQWPLYSAPGLCSNQLFDNVSGHTEAFEQCSKTMFIGSDSFELEACVVDSSGRPIYRG